MQRHHFANFFSESVDAKDVTTTHQLQKAFCRQGFLSPGDFLDQVFERVGGWQKLYDAGRPNVIAGDRRHSCQQVLSKIFREKLTEEMKRLKQAIVKKIVLRESKENKVQFDTTENLRESESREKKVQFDITENLRGSGESKSRKKCTKDLQVKKKRHSGKCCSIM